MTGMPSCSPAQATVGGSARFAGEEESAKLPEISSSDQAAVGVFALDRTKAVGAVKKTRTRCCSMTRQKAPASGVPTGFYSYMTLSGFTP